MTELHSLLQEPDLLDQVNNTLSRIDALQDRDNSRRHPPWRPDPYADEVRGYQQAHDQGERQKLNQSLLNLATSVVPATKVMAATRSLNPNTMKGVDDHIRYKNRTDPGDWRLNPLTTPLFRGYLAYKAPSYVGPVGRYARPPASAPKHPLPQEYLSPADFHALAGAGWGSKHLKGHAYSAGQKIDYWNEMARRGGLDAGGGHRAPYIPLKPEMLY